jgi:WD40 repeat protein
VTDFGLATLAERSGEETASGTVLGTPAYMAPEQAEGRLKAVGPATDVYALGAILYELLVRRPPFRGATDVATLRQVVADEPARPRRLRPGLPRELEAICLKCLEKEPGRRYAGAGALAEDLERFLAGEPVRARPAGPWARSWKWARRRPSAAALVVVTALALMAALAGTLWHTRTLGRSLKDRERALAESDRLRLEGLARESRLRDHLYVADLRLARDTWDLPRARELLDRHRPGEAEEDRRGFEWHWLRAVCQPEKATFRAHDSGLLCAAVSPDDRFLVTGDRKGAVKVWDLTTLQKVGSLAGHTDEVQRAVFARDGRALATCSKDRSIRLWDVATWKQAGCLSGTHEMTVTSVAFSPDGGILASCGRDHRIALWELPRGRLLRRWVGHADVVHDVAFTPDGRTLFSVGKDNWVRSWDVADGRERARFSCGQNFPLRLSLTPDGRTVVTAGDSRTILLWNLAGAAEPVDLKVPANLRSLAISPQGSTLVAGGGDGFLSVWELQPGSTGAPARRILRTSGDELREVAFAHQGTTLITAAEEGTVTLWDMGRIAGREQLAVSPSRISSAAVSPNGRQAAWAAHDGSVHLWDLAAQRLVRTLQLGSPVEYLAFAPSGQAVAAGSTGIVRVWETATGGEVMVLRQWAGMYVKGIAFSPSGDLVATLDEDGSVRLWGYPSGALQGICDGPRGACYQLAFSPDAQTLAVASEDGTVRLWDPRARERRAVLRGDSGSADVLVFAPDGRTLAVGYRGGIVRLWEPASAQQRHAQLDHHEGFARLAISPDSRTLVSVAVTGTVKFWHLPTGQEIPIRLADSNRLTCVAFSPDGRTLLAGTRPEREGGPYALVMFRGEPPGQ